MGRSTASGTGPRRRGFGLRGALFAHREHTLYERRCFGAHAAATQHPREDLQLLVVGHLVQSHTGALQRWMRRRDPRELREVDGMQRGRKAW